MEVYHRAAHIVVPKFEAASFTSTGFDSAESKASFLRKLCKWIVAGMPQEEFLRTDKPLYYNLYQRFDHIAHTNRHGFWDNWFATPVLQLYFLTYHSHQPIYGMPEYTWSDVQRRFKSWILTSGIYEIYEAAAAEYAEVQNGSTALLSLLALSPSARAKVLAKVEQALAKSKSSD